ncbi:MAG: PxKF domain-containing protein, partial [Thermoanaerobaculia bacterium]
VQLDWPAAVGVSEHVPPETPADALATVTVPAGEEAVPVVSASFTVTDGIGGSCTATLAAGGCPLAPALAGTVTLTATYSGDVFFSASSGTRLHSVVPPYNFTGFLTPLSAAGTLAAPSNSGEANFTQGVPVKWQLTDSSGNTVTDLTSTQTLSASYYTGGVCTAGAATGPSSLLYNPTTGATGGSTFRTSGGAFIFNWATKKLATGPGCYEVILQLNDGSAPRATQITLR